MSQYPYGYGMIRVGETFPFHLSRLIETARASRTILTGQSVIYNIYVYIEHLLREDLP